jgi:hypothetical protein
VLEIEAADGLPGVAGGIGSSIANERRKLVALNVKALAGMTVAKKLSAPSGPGRSVIGPYWQAEIVPTVVQPETAAVGEADSSRRESLTTRSKLVKAEVFETVPAPTPGTRFVVVSGTRRLETRAPWKLHRS